MNRIDLILEEIRNQPKLLKEYLNKIRNKYINIPNIENIILTGCGDSYIAALLINQLKGIEVEDPYELYNKKINSSKCLMIISVSGRTIANIKLAEKAKSEGIKIYVITGNPMSKLAKLADEVIDIEYRENIILPGTLSFTKTLLTLYSLFNIEFNLDYISDKKIEDFFLDFKYANGENFFIITSPGFFPLSLYWKAKILEMVGSKVMVERCEQFLHMDLFAVNKEDCLIIIGKEDARCEKIYEVMKDQLRFCRYIKLINDLPTAFIEGSIAAQIFSYNVMLNRGYKDVHFANSNMLKISDMMIY